MNKYSSTISDDPDPAGISTASHPSSAPTPIPPPNESELSLTSKVSPKPKTIFTRFLQRIASGTNRITTAASPPELIRESPPPPVVMTNQNRLLHHSPFSTGFFGALGVIFAIALFQATSQVQNVLILAIMSLFFALGLNPLVETLIRRRLPRGLAVALVSLMVIFIIVLGVYTIVPIASSQIKHLSDNVPFWLNNLLQNETLARWNRDYSLISKLNDFLLSEKLMEQTYGGLLGAGKILANLVFSVIMTLVLTIYFLASLPAIKNVIYHLAPASRRERTRFLADEMFRGIAGYLSGMFVIVTVAATCSFIFMQFVGLKDYALALAFVVALFCFIPLVGSSLAMLSVALVGFGINLTTGVVTIIYFLCYQQLEAYVLYPKVMGHTVKVPGVLVVLSAVIGGILFGVIGALIAIPTAAALLLLYREVLLPHLDTK